MKWPEITKDTPLEEVKRIHQLIWDFVIEYGEKPNTPYINNCVACEYALRIASRKTTHSYVNFYELCVNCPINWGNTTCKYSNSLYSKWMRYKDEAIRTKVYAKQIRDMSFKHEEKKQ